MTANGMPIPIPIFAPLVKPLGVEVPVVVCPFVAEIGLEVV